MTSKINISTKRYDKALTYMALTIDKHGDEYWPIFQVLEAEYNCILEKKNKIRSRINVTPEKNTVIYSKPKMVVYESV